MPEVTLTFRPRRQQDMTLRLPPGATVRDVLAAVGAPPSSTVVVRGRDPIPEGEPVRDGEDLLLLSSFSGG